MPLRFRRTLKIAPGVRINLTKTGISARVGPRGAGVTVGTSGTTVSAGIPGSGLHVSQKLKKSAAPSNEVTSVPVSEGSAKGLGFFGWLGVLVIMLGLLWLIF
jgi:hypothetical protein